MFEPRLEGRKSIPLNTWPDQDDHLAWMEECFGRRNCGVEKSRDLGLSWALLIVFYKHWLFDKHAMMGLASLTEDKVDLMDDSDSLMWKLDFLHYNMPEWIQNDESGRRILDRTWTGHKFHNNRNKSTITGYACTGNLGRGGRKIAWGMDEFSEWPLNEQQRALDATQHTTRCRYFPGTFSSDSDKFYAILRQEKSSMLKIIADWKDNPAKNPGLYTTLGGYVRPLDQEYVFPADYPFILDGKVRSPWYDGKCREPGATPQSIAREIDRDPQGTTSKVFSTSVLTKAGESCQDPFHIGNLDFTQGEWRPIWVPDKNGRMFIWKDLHKVVDHGRERYQLGYGGPYAVGGDIGTGSGSSDTSNSALEVIDIPSGEQVLEYYWHCIRPTDFAQLAYVLCHWLCEGHDLSWAFLNWENQGVGEAFTKEIIRLGWANCYRTRKETVLYKQRTEKVGYHNSDGGYTLLCEVQRGIQQSETTVRSEKTVFEFGQYEIGGAGTRAGRCVHVGSRASGDAASQGKSHGDCAIAYGLSWMAAKDRPVQREADFVDDYDARLMAEVEAKAKKPRAFAVSLAGGSEEYEDFRSMF